MILSRRRQRNTRLAGTSDDDTENDSRQVTAATINNHVQFSFMIGQ